MNEWRKTTLGEVCEIKHGYAFMGKYFNDEPNGYYLVTPGNFNIGGGFKEGKPKYYTGEVPSDYVLQTGDLIVTMTDLSQAGDTLGYSAIIPHNPNQKYLHNQRIGKVMVFENAANKDYLHWVMRTNNYQDFIVGAATGSTVKHTSPTTIKSYKFLLPPLQTQRSIAEVLSSLDDKIDLLTRQNATLEALAQTYFRQWFVEEANPNWDIVQIKKFGEIICGKTPSTKNADYFGEDICFLKIPDMYENTFVFHTTDGLSLLGKKSQKNKTIPPFSICVSCIATVGLVVINAVECQTNQQINSIILNDNKHLCYLYLFLKNYKEELIALGSGGTTVGNVNTTLFSQIECFDIPDDLLLRFNDVSKPLFDKIFFNTQQIKILQKLRDTLLPKLISGEVRVKQ